MAASPAALVSATNTLAKQYDVLLHAPGHGLNSSHDAQRDSLALLSWELGQFCTSAARQLETSLWGPAFSSVRLISERFEYLLAAHESAKFAN